MSQFILDMTIIITFVTVWYVVFDQYERWNDPRARRRRQRKARRKALRRDLERQGRLMR